jgi:hypothetical protein
MITDNTYHAMRWQHLVAKEVKKMKTKGKKPKPQTKTMYDEVVVVHDDLFERCVRKGLIEKTPYGYYFTPEFFDTLDIYDEE